MSFTNPNDLRTLFSQSLSDMYQKEVPAYGTLLNLVKEINAANLHQNLNHAECLEQFGNLKRISSERHGAIRVGTPQELKILARLFALMGMYPVGYYDLSAANIPVHSTAFRPIQQAALKQNPFRVFTSLLRLELIENPTLRSQAEALLNQRSIISNHLLEFIEQAEHSSGVALKDTEDFIQESVNTFRWHSEALVEDSLYQALNAEHRLVADIVSFHGPHINHLTPRTLDIDAIQQAMITEGLPTKAVIEGPPRRSIPILLRQTSFKALSESIQFKQKDGANHSGQHTARFGEIEMRGAALTPKGRALYDLALNQVRQHVMPAADGSNADEYNQLMQRIFSKHLPDALNELYDNNLIYVEYQVNEKMADQHNGQTLTKDQLLSLNILLYTTLVYEDFLPVSAAGIFQSNLGDEQASSLEHSSSEQDDFVNALGTKIHDPFELYQAHQDSSLLECHQQLKLHYHINVTP